MKANKAIIIGASSGIGRELAKILHQKGFIVGVTARRDHLLQELKNEFKENIYTCQMNVSDFDSSRKQFKNLIQDMGGVDLVVVSAGIGFLNHELDWEKEKNTIDVNVSGFVSLTQLTMNYFLKQKHGHLVGISSIAALTGNRSAPAYNASKAFISNYMEALRQKVTHEKHLITVTDVLPGYVKTNMAQGENLFWMSSAEKAARQIYHAIKKKKKVVYVTKRWRLVAWILKATPGWVLERL